MRLLESSSRSSSTDPSRSTGTRPARRSAGSGSPAKTMRQGGPGAPLPQPYGDVRSHVRNSAERRRGAVAIDDRPPERASIDAGRAERPRKSDPRNRMDGNQLVAERDAPVLERRIDAHALELPEAE